MKNIFEKSMFLIIKIRLVLDNLCMWWAELESSWGDDEVLWRAFDLCGFGGNCFCFILLIRKIMIYIRMLRGL